MAWNYLPLVEMKELGENASNLLRDFLARNEIAVGFRPGPDEVKTVERWHGSTADTKGVIYIRAALAQGLTHDNVAGLKAVSKEIADLTKRGMRIVLMDVPESTAKALATVTDLTFMRAKVDTQGEPHLVLKEEPKLVEGTP